MKNISRKEFIRVSFLSSMAVPLIGLYNCKGNPEKPVAAKPEVIPKKYIDNLGLQVFAVRDMLQEDADSVFQRISKIGIKNIELFDPYTLNEYVPLIRNHGMVPYCCHFLPGYISGKWDTARQFGFSPPEDYNFENILEDCQATGIKYLGIAIMMPEERESISDYQKFAEQVNLAAEKSKQAGIQLYYHNHSFEFKPDGDAIPMQEMLNIFDPDLVKIEMDAFWVTISGNDPLEWMDRIGDRLLFVHLKDLMKDTPLNYDMFEVEEGVFTELGTGIIDFEPILKKARSMGVDFAFIDQDSSKLDIMESIKKNFEYIKKVGV